MNRTFFVVSQYNKPLAMEVRPQIAFASSTAIVRIQNNLAKSNSHYTFLS